MRKGPSTSAQGGGHGSADAHPSTAAQDGGGRATHPSTPLRVAERRLYAAWPTHRLVAALAFGSLWFFAVPFAGSGFMWLGGGYILALIIVAGIDYGWLADASHCSVQRTCGRVLSIGEQNPVWIEVVHRGQRPLRALVRDDPPREFSVSTRLLRFDVDPDDGERKNYKVNPSERGDYRFGDVYVRYVTTLGLLFRQARVPSEMAVKVYPDIYATKKHMLLARENRVAQMGLRRSKLQGQGQEFERLRDYIPDDSLRHVDWKATARRGSLITREYTVEQSQNIMILLDIGRSMASRTIELNGELGMSKADYAINASVLLAHVAAQSDDRVGLFCFARGPVAYVPPGKGAAQAAALMEALYPLRPRAEEPIYYDNLAFVSQRQRKRSLIFLFTDLIDPDSSQGLISSVGLLVRKHLVVCVALSDYELPTLVDSAPSKPADVYSQAVALGIIRERRKALAQLSNQGVVTIDAVPSELSVATVNKYLQLKREARV